VDVSQRTASNILFQVLSRGGKDNLLADSWETLNKADCIIGPFRIGSEGAFVSTQLRYFRQDDLTHLMGNLIFNFRLEFKV